MDSNFKKSRSGKIVGEPSGILRWGTSVMFMIFLIILLLSSFIPYNEVIQGEVVVTSENPPIHLLARRSGKISAINFKPGDSIGEGDVLALLENNAEAKDVIYVKDKLKAALPVYTSTVPLDEGFPGQLNLGTSIQPFYNIFLSTYRKMILDQSSHENFIIQSKLQDQITAQVENLQSKEQEILVTRQTLKIQEINFERYKKLYEKGVVSSNDLEKVENIYLDEKRKLIIQDQQYNQLMVEKNAAELDQLKTLNADFKNNNTLEAELLLARQNLLNLFDWEEENLLESPISGRLFYNNIWQKYQNIEKDEVVFMVVPFDRQKLIGKCHVPVKNSGKVKIGQQVFLKLDDFPYREHGIVKASVSSVSAIQSLDKSSGYVIYLAINNLKTSYGKDLEFNQELIGTAEILLEKSSILNRIFYQFRSLWTME